MLFNEPVRWSYRLRVTFTRALRYCDVSPEPSRAEYVGRSSGLTRDLKLRRRRAEKAAGKCQPRPRDPVGAAAHLWALHPRVKSAAAPRLPRRQSAEPLTSTWPQLHSSAQDQASVQTISVQKQCIIMKHWPQILWKSLHNRIPNR